jgi:hypothetical protein
MRGTVILLLTAITAGASAQSTPGNVGERADLERILAYLDGVSSGVHCGFTCRLEQATATPGPDVELRRDFAHLRPFLTGGITGPLASCVGALHGRAYCIEVLDRQRNRRGEQERYYFDGRWTVHVECEIHKARVIDRRFDPGLGILPWDLFHAGEVSHADMIRNAAADHRLDMLPMAPSTAEDAGACRLYTLRYPDATGADLHRLDCRVGPRLVQVRSLSLVRGEAVVAQFEVLDHKRVGDLDLPHRLRVESTLMTVSDAAAGPTSIAFHWRIDYSDTCPDPRAFLEDAARSHRLAMGQTQVPILGLQAEITDFVRSIREPHAGRTVPVMDRVACSQAVWPDASEWAKGVITRESALPFAEARDGFDLHIATTVCAGLRGVACSIKTVLADAPEPGMSIAQALACLANHKLDYVSTTCPMHELIAMQDPFIVTPPTKKGRARAEAGLVSQGKCVLWSLHEGRRVLELDVDRANVSVLVSRRDFARQTR